jgi:hypothetical protein
MLRLFRNLFLIVFLCAWTAPLARAQVDGSVEFPVERHSASPPGKIIRVRAEAGLEELADRSISIAPSALAEIAEDLPNLALPTTVEIRVVRDVANLAAASPLGSHPPSWAVGVAYPGLHLVVLGYRRGPEMLAFESTLRHELAHLCLGEALAGRAPRWLDEGFAFLHSSALALDRSLTLTGMAWSRDIYPLSELAEHFPPGENAAERAYAQAYDFTAFLARRGRYADKFDDGDRWAFRDYLAAIAAGKSADQAAHKIYGAGLTQLSDEWFTDLRNRFWMIPLSTLGAVGWVLGALLLVAAYLQRRRRDRVTLRRWEAEEEADPLIPVELVPPRK